MNRRDEGRIDWPGLMRLGLGALRLSPEVFWTMTPRELAATIGASSVAAPMTRDRLQSLARQFPDTCPESETQ